MLSIAKDSQNSEIPPETIHIWLLHLAPANSIQNNFYECLSDDERLKAAKYIAENTRAKFVSARGQMRHLLASYLNCNPAEIKFEYGVHGKPKISEPDRDSIHFNISHSGELALLAVNRHKEIGVDIEKAKPGRQLLKISSRFFSESENADLEVLTSQDQEDGFYRCWTRKEAYLKAIGTGLATPLNAFDVSLLPGDEPVLKCHRLDPLEPVRWKLMDLPVPKGYKGSLATEWNNPTIVMKN